MHQQRLFVQPIIRCEERFETCRRRNSTKRVIRDSRIFFASKFLFILCFLTTILSIILAADIVIFYVIIYNLFIAYMFDLIW